MSGQTSPRPLVYACSGCSSAAQLANHVAVRLDRSGVAEPLAAPAQLTDPATDQAVNNNARQGAATAMAAAAG